MKEFVWAVLIAIYPTGLVIKIEIDMIMLCQKGIYVIENKNYSGWIFGDEKSKNWCEILKGKKIFFL